jgi:hypothetical protein
MDLEAITWVEEDYGGPDRGAYLSEYEFVIHASNISWENLTPDSM